MLFLHIYTPLERLLGLWLSSRFHRLLYMYEDRIYIAYFNDKTLKHYFKQENVVKPDVVFENL